MNESVDVEKRKPTQSDARQNGASYELFILVLTIFALIVATLILIWPLSSANRAVLLRVDFLIGVIFLVDFLIVFWRAPNKANYFFMGGGWLDLLGSVPVIPDLTWTAILRFARLSRSFRIVQHLRTRERSDVIREARESRAQNALLATLLVAIVLIALASLVVLQVERRAPGANIRTGTDAFWWAFVTMTTVGYGDHVPVSLPGQLMAMILMTFGVGIFAVLTGFLATKLLAPQEERPNDDQGLSNSIREELAQLRQENAIMRSQLDAITQMLAQWGRNDDQ